MSNQVNSMNKGLTVKDLVTTGIFTALLFVFVLVGGVFFATNPVLTFFMPAGGGLLAGPIYLLLIAKVHKRWSLSIMGVIMGIIWFVTGMHWAFALGYMITVSYTHLPGMGKTRLALEATKLFAEKNQAKALAISSNGLPIWDDLSTDIPPNSKCIILVDDANELSALSGFADFISKRL